LKSPLGFIPRWEAFSGLLHGLVWPGQRRRLRWGAEKAVT
jgi:hypothetical protein